MRGRLLDYGIAFGLFAATLALLLGTMDIGFPRDEGFYFRHAADYQDWFWRVGQDDKEGERPSLGKEEVSRVWSGNAEHPPLMKMLFGFSWRLLGTKLRPVARLEVKDEGTFAHVDGLHDSEGFDKGARVRILRPARVDDPEPLEARVIARGVVAESGSGRAKVRLNEGGALGSDTFAATCRPPAGDDRVPSVMSGCQALAGPTVLSESTAFRLPSAVLAALLVAAIYLFGAGPIGRVGAFFAAAAFLLVPQAFLHAHLAAFDVPIAALLFFTVAAFWRSLTSRAWAVATGVLWGLALLTKHNAMFLPVALVLWWLSGTRLAKEDGAPDLGRVHRLLGGAAAALVVVLGWRVLGLGGAVVGVAAVLCGLTGLRRRLVFPAFPLAFLTMPAIGLPMLFLLWPRLWYDAYANFAWYLSFHLKHDHYMQVYLGDVLAYPPFPAHFPFLTTALSLPVVTLALVLAGAVVMIARWLRSRERASGVWTFGALLAVHGLWPIALIAMPGTPVFGGIKHWLAAYPYLLLLGGFALARGAEALADVARARAPALRVAIAAALCALCLAPAARATLHAHPNGTAYYNELIGGVRGAADAGMQRQFWGYSTRLALDYINRHAPENATVYFHKCVWGSYDVYRKEGLLRHDIRHIADLFDVSAAIEQIRRTPYALYHHQKDHDDFELAIWEAYGTDAPVAQWALDGVPIVSVYKNPNR